MEELVDKHDTQPQITRRSFFKVGAALAGALVASPIVYDNREKRKEGEVKLKKEVDRMKELREISGTEAFSKYFGTTPTQLIDQYKSQITLAQQTLQTGIGNEGVRAAFSDFIETGNQSVNSLESLFGNGVPVDVSDAIKSTLIARNLRDKSVAEHRAVYTGLAFTGLAVAGTIVATLAPLEFANEYLANKIEKNNS